MSNSVDEDAKDAKPIVEADREAPEGKCPFHAGKPPQSNQAPGGGTTNRDWWPNQLRVDLLNQHSSRSNPLD